MTISEKIRELMILNHISINKLSQDTNLSFSTISRILSGDTKKPSEETIIILCNYFNIKYEVLVAKIEAIKNKILNNPHFLSENLYKIMKDRGYKNAKSLSIASGIHAGVIGDILSGKTTNPHNNTIKKLASILNVRVEDLNGNIFQDKILADNISMRTIPLFQYNGSEKILFNNNIGETKEWINVMIPKSTINPFAIQLKTDKYQPFYQMGHLLIFEEIIESLTVLNTINTITVLISVDDCIYLSLIKNLKANLIINPIGTNKEIPFKENKHKIFGKIIQEILNKFKNWII